MPAPRPGTTAMADAPLASDVGRAARGAGGVSTSRRAGLARLLAAAVLGALIGLPLAGCGPAGDPARAVPTLLYPAEGKARRLVVVLPGRGDDLAALRASGVAAAIQAQWPDADVVLAELALGYYTAGVASQRLHRDVVAPARGRGHDETWLVGGSLGGMGALLYDREHPGAIDGLILLAPYLGEPSLHAEIRAAGGLGAWSPEPVGAVDAGNWQRALWSHLRRRVDEPLARPEIWLAYGDRDRLRGAYPLLDNVLRPEQVLVRDGGHRWSVWVPALGEVLRRIDAPRKATPTP